MKGERVTIVESVDYMKPFTSRGSMEVVCCDVLNTLARAVGMNIYKDNDVLVLVLLIVVFVVLIGLRVRRALAATPPSESRSP